MHTQEGSDNNKWEVIWAEETRIEAEKFSETVILQTVEEDRKWDKFAA